MSANRGVFAEVTVRVFDRGPDAKFRGDCGLCGSSLRYEAELADFSVVREFGGSPWEAVHRMVSNHRGLLERRWSAWT